MDASATNDAAVKGFQAKFAANYGAAPFDWKAILAMLLAMFTGCVIPPTPANIRAQVQRDTVQGWMLVKLWFMGVPVAQRRKAVPAIAKTFHEGTDEEIDSWVAAAQEFE